MSGDPVSPSLFNCLRSMVHGLWSMVRWTENTHLPSILFSIDEPPLHPQTSLAPYRAHPDALGADRLAVCRPDAGDDPQRGLQSGRVHGDAGEGSRPGIGMGHPPA